MLTCKEVFKLTCLSSVSGSDLPVARLIPRAIASDSSVTDSETLDSAFPDVFPVNGDPGQQSNRPGDASGVMAWTLSWTWFRSLGNCEEGGCLPHE
ncbi:hypothetical protein MTP99_005871 [Tenebrio molitor]|nr:hypothetical protein MTP99_005871 [Tenebrio molitor]